MAGTYSHHRRRFVEESALQNGHWYLDAATRALYIVPTIGRAEGPAGPLLDQLNTLYGPQPLTDVSTDVIANITGLEPVSWQDRMFSPTSGYYKA